LVEHRTLTPEAIGSRPIVPAKLEKFIMNYQKIYNNIINNRKLTPYVGYTEIHHILPRALDGTDEAHNLVKLSAREHFICHYLLTKIYKTGPEHRKMLRAFLMMLVSSNGQQRYIPARKYESLRLKHAQHLSEEYTGSGNSQFGTAWISNPDTAESLKVLATSLIPSGFFPGRNLKWKVCTSCNDQHTMQGKLCIVCKNNFKARFNNKTKKEDPYKKPKRTAHEKTCPICSVVFMGIDSKYCSVSCSKANGNSAVAKQVMDDISNVFNTLTAAAKFHDVSVETIRNRIKKGKYKLMEE
jgi:hypothetical protein